MSKEVLKIKPFEKKQKAILTEKYRVAAYCRVSTLRDQQTNSYENQMSYYMNFINCNPNWELAGIYADRYSGTKMEKRNEFQRLMADCEAGQIDLIITKSIARWARNTTEMLNSIRKLKNLNIAVYFEKERINTLETSSELLMTILSSIAQAEAEAISTNQKWAIQYRFQNGTFRQFLPYGYQYDENGQIIINREEAAVIKRIFQMYLDGIGQSTIVQILMEEGIEIKIGKIQYLISNVIYTGNLLQQKTLTVDCITGKRKRNHGELPQYLIENNHEGIITLDDFKTANKILNYRNKNLTNGERYLFSGKIQCKDCGATFKRRISSSGKVCWVCANQLAGKEKEECSQNQRLSEIVIKQAFIALCNKLIVNPMFLNRYLERFQEYHDHESKITDKKHNEIREKIDNLNRQYQILNQMMGDGYLDPAFYMPQKNKIDHEMSELLNKKTLLEQRESFAELENTKTINRLLRRHFVMIEFHEELFAMIVEKVIVKSGTELGFQLINGLCLSEKIEVI